MNQLYRELADECHGEVRSFGLAYNSASIRISRPTHTLVPTLWPRYGNLWKEMVDEKIADAFIVGDYEICTSPPSHPYWKAKTLIPAPKGDLFAWAAEQYQPYCKDKAKLYLFSEWMTHERNALDANMKRWAKRVLDNKFDGIDVHEACNFESFDGSGVHETSSKMDILKSFHNQLEDK